MFPEHITETQIVCALRFLGYEWEKASGIAEEGATGAGLSRLITPVVDDLILHETEEDNFAAFFGLQRFLFKWGGERLTKRSREHVAFDFLFLHLYRMIPPYRFAHEEYVARWNREFKADAENVAAYVRKTFKRRAGERK